MHPIKFIWTARALWNKIFYGHIGNLTYIGKPLFIEGRKNIEIGNRTRIFPGIRMEAIGSGKIEIGSNVAIEQNCHITSADSTLVINDDVVVLANSFITNLDHNYENISKNVLQQGYISKETIIGEGCFIGFGSAIQAGTKLGKHCVIGAHSVVRGNFPDYCVIVGCPARIIKKYNVKTNTWEKVEN